MQYPVDSPHPQVAGMEYNYNICGIGLQPEPLLTNER